MTGKRWWRRLATRYLMRYPSRYLCRLTNHERHRLFGQGAQSRESGPARAARLGSLLSNTAVLLSYALARVIRGR